MIHWHQQELTQQIEKRILAALGAGMHVSVALARAGVSRQTYNGWMQRADYPTETRYIEFRRRVDDALCSVEETALRFVIDAAENDWKAAAWFLERRFSKRWGKPDHNAAAVAAPKTEDISCLTHAEALVYMAAKSKMAQTEADRSEYERHMEALRTIQ